MSIREKIFAAVPQYETAELDLFGQKFPVRVLLVSMTEFNARMKVFSDSTVDGIAGEMSFWFYEEDGSRMFEPEDLKKLPASAVQQMMRVFTRVNTGAEAKNA